MSGLFSNTYNFFRSGWGHEWVTVPLTLVLAIHCFLWLATSFVFWDFGWISYFWHRVMFGVVCIFVWGSLLDDATKDKEKSE